MLLEETKKKIDSITKKIRTIDNEVDRLNKQISYFTNKEIISKLYLDEQNCVNDISSLSDYLSSIEKKASYYEKKYLSTKNEIKDKSTFFSKLFPSNELKQLREDLKSHRNGLDNFRKRQKEYKEKHNNITSRLNDIRKKIKEFNEFNSIEVAYDLYYKDKEIYKLRQELPDLEVLLKNLQEALSNEYATLKNLNEEYSRAKAFQDELDEAANGYYRKLIHEKVKDVFGNGNPSLIMKDRSKSIELITAKIARSEEKIKARLEKQKVRIEQQRICKKIIIDGNNLCYKNGTVFNGLNALQAICSALLPSYQLHVIFDSSITRLTGQSTKAIRNMLPSQIEVSIAVRNVEADELIVSVASQDSSFFILSNDKFVDYYNFDAIKNHRIFTYNIFEESFIISALNINGRYS